MLACPYCQNQQQTFFCEGKDRLLGIYPEIKAYQQCSGCHAILQSTPPNLEEIKTFYGTEDTAYKVYKPQAPQPRDWSLLNPLPLTGKVLDIGCAAGSTLSSFLAAHPTWQATGMDFSAAALKNAKQNLPATTTLIEGDILERLKSLASDTYDLIICEHVIEHLLNPRELLKQIERILKKDGQVFLGYPNGGSWLTRLAKTYAYHLDAPRHIYIPSHKSITKLANHTGLTIKNWEGQTYPSCAWRSLAYARGYPSETYMRHWGIRIHALFLRPWKSISPNLFSKINTVLTKNNHQKTLR